MPCLDFYKRDRSPHPALNTGLLTHHRLNGSGGSASSDQRGHMRNENVVTTLIGRATACLRAVARNPGRLSSAIATYDILRIAMESLDVDGMKNVKDGTSVPARMWAVGWRKRACGRGIGTLA